MESRVELLTLIGIEILKVETALIQIPWNNNKNNNRLIIITEWTVDSSQSIWDGSLSGSPDCQRQGQIPCRVSSRYGVVCTYMQCRFCLFNEQRTALQVSFLYPVLCTLYSVSTLLSRTETDSQQFLSMMWGTWRIGFGKIGVLLCIIIQRTEYRVVLLLLFKSWINNNIYGRRDASRNTWVLQVSSRNTE